MSIHTTLWGVPSPFPAALDQFLNLRTMTSPHCGQGCGLTVWGKVSVWVILCLDMHPRQFSLVRCDEKKCRPVPTLWHHHMNWGVERKAQLPLFITLDGFVFVFCILDIPLNPYVPSWKVALRSYLHLRLHLKKNISEKCSGGHASHSQGLPYFSFRPTKQWDFPGNVSTGGCDSLPLVLLTSKHHDSRLSYALHFLYIISHQMCCAVERVEIPLSLSLSLAPSCSCSYSTRLWKGGRRSRELQFGVLHVCETGLSQLGVK